jgi:4-amino-4-deoxy-L-arabinose transferase-like glycosyltransferase
MKSESSLPHFRDPAILVVIHLILAAVAFQPVPHPGGDSAVYLSVARSILQGTYRDIFDPAQPYHMVYPPGFPLIIAAGLLAGLKPWIGLKLVIVAFSAAMVLFTWIYARREGRMIAVVAAGALAISPGVISLSHWELSDVPFTAFAIASLIMWRRSETGTTRTLAFATILTLATYSVRSAGIALIVAAAMWLAVRKRWRDLGIFAAIIVPPATAWSVFTRGQAGYFDQLFIADAYSQRREIGIGDLAARFAVASEPSLEAC